MNDFGFSLIILAFFFAIRGFLVAFIFMGNKDPQQFTQNGIFVGVFDENMRMFIIVHQILTTAQIDRNKKPKC